MTSPPRVAWTFAATSGSDREIRARQAGHSGHGPAAPECQQKRGSDLKGLAEKFLNFACFESAQSATANLDSHSLLGSGAI